MKKEEKLTPEIIFKMFAENERRFAENERRFDKTREESKENDRKYNERFEKISAEMDKRDKKLTDKINKMIGHFDRQFGKLLESLIQHSTINLFKELGIKITHSQPKPERIYKNMNMEFDLLLLNETEIVVLEAKVSLKKQKVYQFIKKIENFKLFFKEFKNYKVHAGLAFITANSNAIELAEENGFYLLKLRNEEYMEFGNTPKFKPIMY